MAQQCNVLLFTYVLLKVNNCKYNDAENCALLILNQSCKIIIQAVVTYEVLTAINVHYLHKLMASSAVCNSSTLSVPT